MRIINAPCRPIRFAAISASTVFAIALAIVAGLIFAVLFKIVLLDRKPKSTPPPITKKLTVAAVNMLDRQQILPIHVKTITVSEEEYKQRTKGRTDALVGNQPVGRTTVQVVKAEEPIFEEQLEKLGYPPPVSEFLREGKRAVIIEVGSKDAMVQTRDIVDVYCTMNNDAFGPGASGTATARIVEQARVIARFNTTRTAAQARPEDPTRTYTLEVSPFRFALIELAKRAGAQFSLSVCQRPVDEQAMIGQASDNGERRVQEPDPSRVNMSHLAALFGVNEGQPVPVWEIERYVGIEKKKSMTFFATEDTNRQDTQRPMAEVPPSNILPAAERQGRSNRVQPADFSKSSRSDVVPNSNTSSSALWKHARPSDAINDSRRAGFSAGSPTNPSRTSWRYASADPSIRPANFSSSDTPRWTHARSSDAIADSRRAGFGPGSPTNPAQTSWRFAKYSGDTLASNDGNMGFRPTSGGKSGCTS